MNNKISPKDVLEYEIIGNVLYYSYENLYGLWSVSERDMTLNTKYPKPKDVLDDSLTFKDAYDLANFLAHHGYIG